MLIIFLVCKLNAFCLFCDSKGSFVAFLITLVFFRMDGSMVVVGAWFCGAILTLMLHEVCLNFLKVAIWFIGSQYCTVLFNIGGNYILYGKKDLQSTPDHTETPTEEFSWRFCRDKTVGLLLKDWFYIKDTTISQY